MSKGPHLPTTSTTTNVLIMLASLKALPGWDFIPTGNVGPRSLL
jgi:hypothetical protein